MKKNFSVNIGGRIFNIDDDAFERLNSYLARLRSFFSPDEGRDEILSDIEMRIAELLEQKKSLGIVIVGLQQVEEVIGSMGEPDQLSENGTARPQQSFKTRTPGKLFRDPDHRQIGGVAAGIAAWFGIDPLWIRLLFGILVFIYGIGAILYAVLWLILPVARTTTERLEMQRQTINIDTMRNEISLTGSALKNTGNSVMHSLGKILRFLTELAGHLFRLILKIFRLASGVMLLLLVLAIFLGLGLGFIIREPIHIQMYFLDSTTQASMLAWLLPGASVRWLVYISGIMLLIGITGMFIFLGLRLMLKWPPLRWQVMLVLGLLLAAGIITGGGAVYQYSCSVAEKASSSANQTYPLKNKVIHLSAISAEPEEYWSPLSGNDLSKRRQEVIGKINLSLRPAAADSLIMTTIRSASGLSESRASEFLAPLNYSCNFRDTLLLLNPWFSFPKSDGMHNQSVDLILGIPVNTTVLIDEHLGWKLNFRDYVEGFDDGGEFIMTATGLKMKNPPKKENDSIR